MRTELVHRCPRCDAQVVTYIPADVYHACPKRAAKGPKLIRYEVEGGESNGR